MKLRIRPVIGLSSLVYAILAPGEGWLVDKYHAVAQAEAFKTYLLK